MSPATHKIVIIAAPSGAGKTSVTRHLLSTFPDKLAFSVSCATRKPRGNEVNGVDYYFITPEEFRARIENHEFAEWEMVYHDKYYGTLKSEMQRIWEKGKSPLLDVDVKGGINIQEQYQGQTLSLFIEPPSIEELERRLRKRGTETEESIRSRVEKAAYELSFRDRFDRVILNDVLLNACAEAEAAVRAFLFS